MKPTKAAPPKTPAHTCACGAHKYPRKIICRGCEAACDWRLVERYGLATGRAKKVFADELRAFARTRRKAKQ